jgi:transposase-like protein
VINTDLAPIYSSAIPDTKKEWTLRNRCRHRPSLGARFIQREMVVSDTSKPSIRSSPWMRGASVQYLNNILEQDHRAIKRRVNAKQGFREFQAARRTIQGYEAIHMIRKGQARWVAGDDLLRQIQFIDNLFDLAA